MTGQVDWHAVDESVLEAVGCIALADAVAGTAPVFPVVDNVLVYIETGLDLVFVGADIALASVEVGTEVVPDAGVVQIVVVECREYIDRLTIDLAQCSEQTESGKLAAHIERQVADAGNNDAGTKFVDLTAGCTLVD